MHRSSLVLSIREVVDVAVAGTLAAATMTLSSVFVVWNRLRLRRTIGPARSSRSGQAQ